MNNLKSLLNKVEEMKKEERPKDAPAVIEIWKEADGFKAYRLEIFKGDALDVLLAYFEKSDKAVEEVARIVETVSFKDGTTPEDIRDYVFSHIKPKGIKPMIVHKGENWEDADGKIFELLGSKFLLI